MKYAWIQSHRKEFSIASMCEFLNVSRSGFYDWQDAPKTEREKENEELIEQLGILFQEGRGTYGTRRLKRKLKEVGLYSQSASNQPVDEACWIGLQNKT